MKQQDWIRIATRVRQAMVCYKPYERIPMEIKIHELSKEYKEKYGERFDYNNKPQDF